MKAELPDSDSSNGESSYDDLWIVKFLNQKENKYLERIQDNFLCDRFNFYGFKEKIDKFEQAYSAIQDMEESTDPFTESVVYLLAHQRYIYTKAGLDSILNRVLNREYGTCSKYGCEGVPFIPTGLTNEPNKMKTKVFCQNCNTLYEPRGSLRNLDGCAWGIGYAHFLILTYPYNFEKKKEVIYVPRVFGFQLHRRDNNDSN